MKRIALACFVLVASGELIASLVGIEILHIFCKPLIMITLGLYYLSSVSAFERSNVVLGALLFSFAGDVLLMFPGYFISGLIAFLLSHILYIIAYRQYRDEPEENVLRGVQRVRLAFPVILAGTGLVIILYPKLGELKIPVMVYTVVITTMVLSALFRFGRTTSNSFWLVFAGAILFMISDSILAINKFLAPVDFGNFLIMLTYMSGQFLIVQGLIKHQKSV